MEIKQYDNYDRHFELMEERQDNNNSFTTIALSLLSVAILYIMVMHKMERLHKEENEN